jgi:hypothetical protein
MSAWGHGSNAYMSLPFEWYGVRAQGTRMVHNWSVYARMLGC